MCIHGRVCGTCAFVIERRSTGQNTIERRTTIQNAIELRSKVQNKVERRTTGQNVIERRSTGQNTIERKTTGRGISLNRGQQDRMLSNKDQKISIRLNGRQ